MAVVRAAAAADLSPRTARRCALRTPLPQQAGHLQSADVLPCPRSGSQGPCEIDPFGENLGSLIERCQADAALNSDERVVERYAAIVGTAVADFSSEGRSATAPRAGSPCQRHRARAGQTQERTLGSHQAARGLKS